LTRPLSHNTLCNLFEVASYRCTLRCICDLKQNIKLLCCWM
jgi:hypothetical protein